MGTSTELTEEQISNHVLRPKFGLQYDDINPELQRLMRKLDKVDNLTTKLILRENYETAFNVFNHDEYKDSPMALVTAHPKENVTELSALYNRIRRYHLHGIKEISGQSIDSFLGNPKHINDLLFEMAAQELPKKNAGSAELVDMLEKHLVQLKTGK